MPHDFESFWPFYVSQHRHPINRAFHFAGTTAAMGVIAASFVRRKPALLALAPVVGYGASWAGHFLFERNKPAAFQRPWWSFLGDLRMWSRTVAGTFHSDLAADASTASANGT
jgi:hypothetical protein